MAITIQFVFGKKQETMRENREQKSYQHLFHFPSETTGIFTILANGALSQGSFKHREKTGNNVRKSRTEQLPAFSSLSLRNNTCF